MGKGAVLLPILLVFPALALSALAVPETSVTRTHLLKDIERSSITLGLGMESELREQRVYSADYLFGYLGYAPLDWVELGVAAHAIGLSAYPSVDAKVDLVDVFFDSSRWSCLLVGGVGGLPEDLVFYHVGLGLNLRLTGYLQLYVAAGSDSVSRALSLQAGAWIAPLQSLGFSASGKLVMGQEGTELMLSIAPMARFYLQRAAGSE